MTYTPLVVILIVLIVGAATTLAVLFVASRRGYFRNLKSGAYVIFDDDEPVGEPQDQFFHTDETEPEGASESSA